jgi:uncharacterized protein YxeA
MKTILTIIFVAIAIWAIIGLMIGFKESKWDQDYILLKSLIIKSDAKSKTDYDTIAQEFDNFYWNNDQQMRVRKSLWATFQYKFRDISPINIEK